MLGNLLDFICAWHYDAEQSRALSVLYDGRMVSDHCFYIILKQARRISGMKDWIRSLFSIRAPFRDYGMLAVMEAAFFLPQCLISGYEQGAPLIAVIVMVPMMLFGGGLEEAGWRYILQPELEKKYGFVVSTLVVSVIWWLWHMPLFYIQGVSQYGGNFLAFGVNVLGLSFGLAAIYKRTRNIWLCILFHCLTNSLSGVYLVKDNIMGNIASAFVMVSISLEIARTKGNKKLQ